MESLLIMSVPFLLLLLFTIAIAYDNKELTNENKSLYSLINQIRQDNTEERKYLERKIKYYEKQKAKISTAKKD